MSLSLSVQIWPTLQKQESAGRHALPTCPSSLIPAAARVVPGHLQLLYQRKMIVGGQSLPSFPGGKNDADKVSVVILPTQEAGAINMDNS